MSEPSLTGSPELQGRGGRPFPLAAVRIRRRPEFKGGASSALFEDSLDERAQRIVFLLSGQLLSGAFVPRRYVERRTELGECAGFQAKGLIVQAEPVVKLGILGRKSLRCNKMLLGILAHDGMTRHGTREHSAVSTP